MKNKILNNTKGITLIALVITIVVLLILAGIIISAISGSKILEKANKAKENHRIAELVEELQMKIEEVKIDKRGKATLQDLVEAFDEDAINEYIVALSEIATINSEKPDASSASKIYVIYKKYQFEIDLNFNVRFVKKVDAEEDIENLEETQTGLISETEYKINDTILTYDKIVVVGTGETYTTIKSALDYLCDNGYKSNAAIVLKEGTYDTANIHNGNSYNINTKYNGM